MVNFPPSSRDHQFKTIHIGKDPSKTHETHDIGALKMAIPNLDVGGININRRRAYADVLEVLKIMNMLGQGAPVDSENLFPPSPPPPEPRPARPSPPSPSETRQFSPPEAPRTEAPRAEQVREQPQEDLSRETRSQAAQVQSQSPQIEPSSSPPVTEFEARQPSATPSPAQKGGPQLEERTAVPTAGKSGQELISTMKGFSSEQRDAMLGQVLDVSQLLREGTGEKVQEGSPKAIFQIVLVLQRFEALDKNLNHLMSQIQQALKQGKTLSPAMTKEFNAALKELQNKMDALQKKTQQEISQFIAEETKSLPGNPQTATAILKAKSEQLLMQMQTLLRQNLEKAKVADQTQLTLAGQSKPSTSVPPGTKETAQPSPQMPETSLPSEKPSLSQMEQRGKLTADSQSPRLTTPGANVEQSQLITEPKPTAKSSETLPTLIQSSSDLRALVEKMQKKEVIFPLNIALIYPLDKEKTLTAKGEIKLDPNKRAGEQGKRWGVCGGGCAQAMALIPAGPALFGDPIKRDNEQFVHVTDLNAFLIAVDPVTNEQYADWLNEALAKQKIRLSGDGMIFDLKNRVLCKTHWSAQTSQIQALVSQEQYIFSPMKGTQLHPVVQVSWDGAIAYCLDNGFRLPSEAEWEKAAGMQLLTENEPPSRFLYGFGKNEIDTTCANFREEIRAYDDNRTTPVGFYNGESVFTKGGKNYKSKNSISPYGCYDMSGNVREWVSDGTEFERVTKGGSYNSFPNELTVTSRTLFDLRTCQADIGFRVVCDL